MDIRDVLLQHTKPLLKVKYIFGWMDRRTERRLSARLSDCGTLLCSGTPQNTSQPPKYPGNAGCNIRPVSETGPVVCPKWSSSSFIVNFVSVNLSLWNSLPFPAGPCGTSASKAASSRAGEAARGSGDHAGVKAALGRMKKRFSLYIRPNSNLSPVDFCRAWTKRNRCSHWNDLPTRRVTPVFMSITWVQMVSAAALMMPQTRRHQTQPHKQARRDNNNINNIFFYFFPESNSKLKLRLNVLSQSGPSTHPCVFLLLKPPAFALIRRFLHVSRVQMPSYSGLVWRVWTNLVGNRLDLFQHTLLHSFVIKGKMATEPMML